MTKPNSDPFGEINADKYDASKAAREAFGSDEESDPRFAPLASDRPGSLRNQILRLANSENDADISRVLRAGGIIHEGDQLPKRATFHLNGGGAVEAEL